MADQNTCKVVLEKVEKKASTLLGKNVDYKEQYNPDILVPFSRYESLVSCDVDMNEYPYYGFDLWNMWEVRYKLNNGRSIQRIGKLIYDTYSENLIESKSMKLYFFGQMKDKLGETHEEADYNFKERVRGDIGKRVNSNYIYFDVYDYNTCVTKSTSTPSTLSAIMSLMRGIYGIEDDEIILDEIEIPKDFQFHQPLTDGEINYDNPNLIKVNQTDKVKKTAFVYYAGKSNCLVTGQPDFCTEYIYVKGKVDVDPLSLLDYLQTFESVNRFHESTAHTIFDRLYKKVKEKDPEAQVTVFSMYTRRGGIDINPFRTSDKEVFERTLELVKNHSWGKTWQQ